MEVRIGQSEEEYGVLVEEQEGVADMRGVIESLDADRAAALFQIKLDDLVELTVKSVGL